MAGVLSCVGIFVLAVELTARFAPFNAAQFEPRYTSTVIKDRHGRLLRVYLADDQQWRIPARLEEIAPVMVDATLAAEDQRFYQHRGVDWIAVGRAALSNIKSGRIVSGASTISMQVAGFAIPSRDRTASRKLYQAFLALQLERHWTKQQILEAYYTQASFGGNVAGVQAAALRYFNKSARHLTTGEAALLAGLPQSPERFRPDRHADRALKRRRYVLSRLSETGKISAQEFETAAQLPLALRMESFPVHAPHMCDELRQQYPDKKHLVSTVDLAIQARAERAIEQVVRTHSTAGVTNGAAVVIDNKSGDLLAMVGSADYWSRANDGQVNAALSFRSPGSALKPLIYARALDIGALAPDEMLFDVPITRAGYSPRNFDQQFRGPISAGRALAWSLNIPAMDALQRVGVEEFTGFLATNRLPLQISRFGDAGLSLAIGTCSVRLLDLTNSYTALANAGNLKPVRWLLAEDQPRSKPWISPGAASVVMEALADENLRSVEDVNPRMKGVQNIAWKTGTSNGLRDAWTVAVSRDITVGVWIGNMDGKASRALIGAEIAAPVALELARGLTKNGKWLSGTIAHGTLTTPPDASNLVTADACAVSGLAATSNCGHRTAGRFLRPHFRQQRCHLHAKVQLDSQTGFSVCRHCEEGITPEEVVRLKVSREVATWLRTNGHPWAEDLEPPHNPSCPVNGRGDAPAIIDPAPGAEIVLLSELPLEQQKIALTARTANPTEEVFWFINGQLAGNGPASESLVINPKPGRHRIICTTRQGMSDESWFVVEAEKPDVAQ